MRNSLEGGEKYPRKTESYLTLGAACSPLQHCSFSAFVWPIDLLPGELCFNCRVFFFSITTPKKAAAALPKGFKFSLSEEVLWFVVTIL